MTLPSHMAAKGYYKKALMVLCVCLAVFASYDTCGKSVGSTLDKIHENEGSWGINSFKINSLREKYEYFDDFIVYVEERILVCSIVIQLNRGMKGSKERVVLRNIIYTILKERSGLREGGNWPKGKIKNRLNAFMGAEAVKSVYFTKFVLL